MTHNSGAQQPSLLPHSLVGWIRPLWHMDHAAFLHVAGMDALVLLLVCRFGLRLFLLCTLLALPILLPINATGAAIQVHRIACDYDVTHTCRRTRVPWSCAQCPTLTTTVRASGPTCWWHTSCHWLPTSSYWTCTARSVLCQPDPGVISPLQFVHFRKAYLRRGDSHHYSVLVTGPCVARAMPQLMWVLQACRRRAGAQSSCARHLTSCTGMCCVCTWRRASTPCVLPPTTHTRYIWIRLHYHTSHLPSRQVLLKYEHAHHKILKRQFVTESMWGDDFLKDDVRAKQAAQSEQVTLPLTVAGKGSCFFVSSHPADLCLGDVEASLIESDVRRPRVRDGGFLCFGGKKVDAELLYQRKLAEHNDKVSAMNQAHSQHDGGGRCVHSSSWQKKSPRTRLWASSHSSRCCRPPKRRRFGVVTRLNINK